MILWVVRLTERVLLVHAVFGSSLVCWSTHKQFFVAQSTIEAKYVAAALKYFR
jgi:hypothetical protein